MPVPPPTMAIGVVAESLQPREPHHGQQRSDVKAGGGRIEADVAGQRRGEQRVAHALRALGEHPAPFEFGIDVHHDVAWGPYYIVRHWSRLRRIVPCSRQFRPPSVNPRAAALT